MQDKFSFANRNLSFWELDVLREQHDFVVVGAGLVGLSTSLSLRERYPKAKILVLERSNIPYGASTRNAGFACFGSLTEILADIDLMSIEKVSNLISNRWHGLRLLRERIGDKYLKYEALGGYEIFKPNEAELFDDTVEKLDSINQLIKKATGLESCFSVQQNKFGFATHESIIYNQHEGQLHPGMMIRRLTELVQLQGIKILFGANVSSYQQLGNNVNLILDNRKEATIKGSHVFFTTNAFTQSLYPSVDLQPARNQVLITKPIKNFKIKGCFHYDTGYVYFRNYENRLLIGGGRNIALNAESTDEFALTNQIQDYLKGLIQGFIMPGIDYEEDKWWSGIIATGADKEPIVKSIADNIHLGVRLSGMGVALGSMIGEQLAKLV